MPAGREEQVLVHRVRSPRRSTAGGAGRRSSRYSWPRSRAAVTSGLAPVTRSCSSRPSRTLIVVSNEPRTSPFSCSQFQPPSAICSAEQPVDDALHVLAEVVADRDGRAVDARLDLTVEERQIVVLPAAVLANHARSRAGRAGPSGRDPRGRSTARVGFVPVHSGKFAPPPHSPSGGWASSNRAPQPSRGDPGALRGDLVGRLVGQVAHDLPTDRGVGIEQPVGHGLRHRHLPLFDVVVVHVMVGHVHASFCHVRDQGVRVGIPYLA